MKWIKELFTAHYIEGKGIMGCRAYSLAWYHEYRHSVQMKNILICTIWTWLPYATVCLGMVMLFFIWLIPKYTTLVWGGIFILPITLFGLLIELDANLYAFYKIITHNAKKVKMNEKGN